MCPGPPGAYGGGHERTRADPRGMERPVRAAQPVRPRLVRLMSRLITTAVAAGIVASVCAAVMLLVRDRPALPAAATAVPIGTARVLRTDVVQRQRFNGTLNYGGTTTISAPGGATPDQVQQARAAVNTAQAALNAALTAAGDTAAANQVAISQAQGEATPAAQQHAEQAQHQADAQVA